MLRQLSSLLIDPRGHVGTMLALCVVPVIALSGGVVDMNRWHVAGNALQNATDAAALGAARFRDEAEADRIAIAEAVARQNWAPAQPKFGDIEGISVVFESNEVTVTGSVTVENFFLPVLGFDQLNINRASVAGPTGAVDPCILALGETNMNGKGAFEVNSNAVVNVPHCTIYSNSLRDDALYSDSNAVVIVNDMYAVGESEDLAVPGFSKEPKANSEPVEDPFASVPAPTWSACDYTDNVEFDLGSNGTANIYPGVYCGDELLIKGSSSTNAVATFHSGEYIIDGGRLLIDSDVKIVDDGGDGVLFYFTNGAVLDINSNVVVELSAPKTGPRTGILFFEDPNTAEHNIHQFNSNAVSTIDGAIYLPMGHLQMDSNGTLSSSSLRSRLVAYSFNINSNFKLNLTADFDGVSGNTDGNYVRLME